jgi:hypothetical protein
MRKTKSSKDMLPSQDKVPGLKPGEVRAIPIREARGILKGIRTNIPRERDRL